MNHEGSSLQCVLLAIQVSSFGDVCLNLLPTFKLHFGLFIIELKGFFSSLREQSLEIFFLDIISQSVACLYIFSTLFSDEVWLTNFLTWLLLFMT